MGIYEEIEQVVRRRCRDLGRGVKPWEVMTWLSAPRAEGSIRRDMANMWKRGRLVRIGGEGKRRGYRVASPMERLAHQTMGTFPPGADVR
jgi:hypothetical protein